ncbi:hypothetical protein CWM47_00970 [Spirosoma pollinicola]|uniref:Glycosyltransferase 2-like domain-containing protein n=1 Tax=Spirosoma pollinicola TaxID=2057025 RepID=A0A2K8YSA6_9BACT|nr:hypothetical protein CWM47_00970 [Spirosoma pollinicola]
MADIKTAYTTLLISLITINHNQTNSACHLLKSTRSISWPYFVIVVVDNGNREGLPNPSWQANCLKEPLIPCNFIN